MIGTSLFVSAGFVGSAIAVAFNSHVGTSQLFERSQLLSSGCSITGPASCHNTTAQNTCCFESPGGLLLQTQFWDTNPTTGPSNSWTIHGLWPDNCDTTFQENCDPSRDYTGISTLLTNNGASDTLSFIEKLWVDINGQNEQFWEHEWATHGTCMSTLVPSCLPSGSPTGAEAVAFFQTVVRLFQTLPTFTWLANEGILPSTSQTFTLSQLTSALQAQSGVIPALDCNSGALNQVSWYFNLKGSVIDGAFIPINAPKAGSCPSSGITYPPKTGATPLPTTTNPGTTTTLHSSTTSTNPGTTSTVPTTTTSGNPTSTSPASGALPTKATLHASTAGGLLSLGTLSTQTLATYTLSGTTSSFTMTSSKGSCGVSSGTFSCGSGVSSTTFSAVSSAGSLLLASGGSTSFSSDGVPSGSTVFPVFTGSGHSNSYTLTISGS